MSLPYNFPRGSETAILVLLGWTVKATAVLALGWVTDFVERRRSADLRHRVWTMAILGSLALPLLGWTLPGWHASLLAPIAGWWGWGHATTVTTSLQISSSMDNALIHFSSPVTASLSSRLFAKLPLLMLVLWAAGVVLMLMKLTVGIARMARLGRQSMVFRDEEWTRGLADLCHDFGIRRKVRLLVCDVSETMPATWGVAQPRIILPAGAADWQAERRRVVLSHELAHIRRHDWLFQICGEILRGLLWFHPLAWHGANRLRQESERACDDAVLHSGIGAQEYATQLVLLARMHNSPDRRFSAALAVARPSTLEKRFAAILNPAVRRNPLSPGACVFVLVLAAGVVLPLAALNLQAQPIKQSVASFAAMSLPSGVASTDGSTAPGTYLPRSGTEETAGGSNPAQYSGGIHGTVYDETGAVVANAMITVTNTETGVTSQTRSDGRGDFTFDAISAGEYSLVVEAPGFTKYVAGQILAGAARPVSLALVLQVGKIQQSVTVETDRNNSPLAPYSPLSQTSVPACNGPLAQPMPIAPSSGNSERAGGLVTTARVILQPDTDHPIYPNAAKASGIAGDVAFHAILGTDGALHSLCLLSANHSDPELAQAAFGAVNQWHYQATMLDGIPIETETQINVRFEINYRSGQPKVATYRAGTEGASTPQCVYCPEPQYPEGANLEPAFVILQATIGIDGRAANISIVKDPGFGFGEKAEQVVKTWRFKPATGPNGAPVAAITKIEVTFRS